MTLDEAIKKAEGIAEEKFNTAVYIMDKMKSDIALSNAEEYKRCSEEHRQLAEWLKELKQLREQEPCEDAISRQAVLALPRNKDRDFKTMEVVSETINVTDIETLPPVNPQPKTGKWIPVSDPLKELPRDRLMWVTYITKYPEGYFYAVDILHYDMTEWSDENTAEATIAYMDYEEPEPYKAESEE